MAGAINEVSVLKHFCQQTLGFCPTTIVLLSRLYYTLQRVKCYITLYSNVLLLTLLHTHSLRERIVSARLFKNTLKKNSQKTKSRLQYLRLSNLKSEHIDTSEVQIHCELLLLGQRHNIWSHII